MRLIDADEARKTMLKLLDHHLMMCNYSADGATQDCIEVLEEAPTIDAVPVVRCKDCKFSHFVKSCSKYECEKCSGFLRYSNDFCSYGERKGEVSE